MPLDVAFFCHATARWGIGYTTGVAMCYYERISIKCDDKKLWKEIKKKLNLKVTEVFSVLEEGES